jgi:hypothetical protein
MNSRRLYVFFGVGSSLNVTSAGVMKIFSVFLYRSFSPLFPFFSKNHSKFLKRDVFCRLSALLTTSSINWSSKSGLGDSRSFNFAM